MTGVHIPITEKMVVAAYEVIAVEGPGGVDSGIVRQAIEAALRAGEVSMGEIGPARVEVTFITHQRDVERVTLTTGGPAHDFGVIGIGNIRKVQVSKA